MKGKFEFEERWEIDGMGVEKEKLEEIKKEKGDEGKKMKEGKKEGGGKVGRR